MSKQTGRISGGVLQDNLKIYQDNSGKDFLNFKNKPSDTATLHLRANPGMSGVKRIGINLENPATELETPSNIKSTNLISSEVQTPSFVINNDITVNSGDIFLNAGNKISLSSLQTDSINIDNNVISTIAPNSHIEITPSGTGIVDFQKSVNVYGSLQATGNIRHGGNLIFGDGPETPDTVRFNTEINSDLIPDVPSQFNLGSSDKRWLNLYSNLLLSEGITSKDLTAGAVKPSLRTGNSYYVSVNGDDSNVGDHPLGPFRTVRRALEAIDSSTQGPTTIHILPGDYDEVLPLEIPSNTTVKGESLRSVTIRPDTGSEYEDVFLLNGESTLEEVTITGYQYDNINDKGYAIRFAPGATVTTRSPYVRNITVITEGTTTTLDDPRGFNAGDAGKGAYIDGDVLLSTTNEASMLFHSVTFITPGVDAITMTNGVRVEWLNSFTYFANRGLYAISGPGRTLEDGSTLRVGAEIRSIGSANVYGNFGAVSDGTDVIMYLIEHNFAYIGAGKIVANDPTYNIEENEFVELNGGRVYHTSTDERGTYRVGSNFFVDFEKGTTSVDTSTVDFDALSQIVIGGGDEETILNYNFIQTGNLRFNQNTALSVSGDFNVSSISDTINLQSSTNISKNLSMTGNLTLDGQLITFGNQPTDTVKLNVNIDQDFLPDDNTRYSLGSSSKRWLNTHVSEAFVDGVQIFDNIITTNTSNENLEFKSRSAGQVWLEDTTFRQDTIGSTYTNDLVFDTPGILRLNTESFVVTKGTTLERTNQTGDIRFNVDDSLFEGYGSTGVTSFSGVYSDDRLTSLTAHKTDNILNLRVAGVKVGEVNAKGLEIHGLQGDSIQFNENRIFTVDSNADLEIRRNGTGNVTLNGQEYFRNNIWTNADSNGALTIFSTDRGYVKIDSTYGFAIPRVDQIVDFQEVMALLPLGQSLTGATLFDSVTADVSVVESGNGQTETGNSSIFGFTDTNSRSIFINFSTALQFDAGVGNINSIDFRGDLGNTTEYFDITFSDGDTYRIAENDGQDGTTFLTSGTFTGKDISSLLTVSGGDTGIFVTVTPSSDIDTDLIGNGNLFEIRFNVTGSGGGFDNYSANNQPNKYFVFRGGIPGEDRILSSKELDTTGIQSVIFQGLVIAGNNNNGGKSPNTGEDLYLQQSNDGISWFYPGSQDDARIVLGDNASLFNVWTAFEKRIEIASNTTYFRIVQFDHSGSNEDEYGISAIRIYIADSQANPEPGSIRFQELTGNTEVFDGTNWIPTTGVEEDPVTDEFMEELVGEWSLILG